MKKYRSRKTVEATLVPFAKLKNRKDLNMLHCSGLTEKDEAYMVHFPNGFKCLIGKEDFERCYELCEDE